MKVLGSGDELIIRINNGYECGVVLLHYDPMPGMMLMLMIMTMMIIPR